MPDVTKGNLKFGFSLSDGMLPSNPTFVFTPVYLPSVMPKV